MLYGILTIAFIIILIFFFYALNAWTSLLISQSLGSPRGVHLSGKKPLTIFLVTNNYTPFSGGVVSAIDAYAQELRSLGHKAIIVTLDFTGQPVEERDILRIWCPMRFLHYHNHMAIPWRSGHTLLRWARKYSPDIIHVYHPFLLGASALKAGKKLNIPVVFSYLTLYDHYTHYVPLPVWITKPITCWLVNNFCAKVDGLIVPGKSIARYIEAQGVKRPMEIMPLSILPVFTQTSFVPKKINPQSRLILLCASRFAPEKNLYFLLDMFKRLEPGRYTLVYMGYGSLEEDLKQYAYQTLQISPEDVMFIIKPTKQELCDWYSKAHLFVFASHSETQGLVLAEAMAQSTPVVALEAPGVEDIVINNVNGYMVHTQEEMASTISALRTSPCTYTHLQHQAWQTAHHYYPRTCTLKLLSYYSCISSKDASFLK